MSKQAYKSVDCTYVTCVYRLIIYLSTDYLVLGGNLTGYCYQQYRPRLDDWGGNGTHRGLWGNKLFHPYQVGTFVDYLR